MRNVVWWRSGSCVSSPSPTASRRRSSIERWERGIRAAHVRAKRGTGQTPTFAPARSQAIVRAGRGRSRHGAPLMIRRSDPAMLSGPASGAVLVLAGLLLCISNGRTVISIAPWWALIFLLRFVRGRGLIVGIGGGLVVSVLAALIQWRGMIPVPGGAYVTITAGLAAVAFLPFAVDRLLAPRIGGFLATFVLPLAFVT